MRVEIRCPVRPTEDPARVREAVLNIFPNIDPATTQEEISAESSGRSPVSWLRQMIHDSRTIDATRVVLESGWDGVSATLVLDKQAAYMGKLRLVHDDVHPPLGAITVTLYFDGTGEFQEFIRWFTPPTRDGRIVGQF